MLVIDEFYLFEIGDSKHFPKSKLSSEAIVVSSLEIVFIEITDDSVTYECAGNNSQGQKQDRIEIKVIGKIKLEPYHMNFNPMICTITPMNY